MSSRFHFYSGILCNKCVHDTISTGHDKTNTIINVALHVNIWGAFEVCECTFHMLLVVFPAGKTYMCAIGLLYIASQKLWVGFPIPFIVCVVSHWMSVEVMLCVDHHAQPLTEH